MKQRCTKNRGLHFLHMALIAMLLIWPVRGHAEQRDVDKELEPQELFARVEQLMSAGQAAAAKELVLQNLVDEGSPLRSSYLLQLGWIQLTLQEFSSAKKHLLQARKKGSASHWVAIYLLQACFQLDDFDCVQLEYEELPDPLLKQQQGLGILAARAAKKNGDGQRAWVVLDRLLSVAPQSKRVLLERLRLLTELKLGRAFVEEISSLAKSPSVFRPAEFAQALALSLQSGLVRETLSGLEVVLLVHPNDPKLAVLQGTVLQKMERPRAAAASFAHAARYEPRWHLQAAALFHEAGARSLALYQNSLVQDRLKKLEQRAIFYLENGSFPQLAALEKPLQRAGLMGRDDIRYAVAYALFQSGQLNRSQKLLSGITEARLFEKAAALRTEMARMRCSGPGNSCS